MWHWAEPQLTELTSDLYYSWWAQHSPPPKMAPLLDIYDITNQINFFPVEFRTFFALFLVMSLRNLFLSFYFFSFQKYKRELWVTEKERTQLFRDCLRLWFCFLFPQLNSFEVLESWSSFLFFPALQSCGISSVTLLFSSCIAYLAILGVPSHQWLLFQVQNGYKYFSGYVPKVVCLLCFCLCWCVLQTKHKQHARG